MTGTLDTGAAVTLQASNDITISNAITADNPSGNGGDLTLQAGRSLLINANITTDNGNLTLTANDTVANGVVDADRDSGSAVITHGRRHCAECGHRHADGQPAQQHRQDLQRPRRGHATEHYRRFDSPKRRHAYNKF